MKSPRTSIYLTSLVWIVPTQMIIALFLFFRGHNAPGGGFIAGLVFASALYLWFSRSGRFTPPPLLPNGLMTFGLLVALISGLPGVVSRGSFMATVGKSVMLFDFGVMLVVIGISLFIIHLFQSDGAL